MNLSLANCRGDCVGSEIRKMANGREIRLAMGTPTRVARAFTYERRVILFAEKLKRGGAEVFYIRDAQL